LKDGIAWMCKALAGSKISKYEETIKLVAKQASNEYLRDKASGYLRYFN
jgi:hypothetical protein